MKRYDRLIEKRFKEWEIRHLGNAALRGLAHQLVTPDRYKPDETQELPPVPSDRFVDGTVEYRLQDIDPSIE